MGARARAGRSCACVTGPLGAGPHDRFPITTEPNVLKELIKPPSVLKTVVNAVTGSSNVASMLPSGQLSNVPWRRMGVKYTSNEVFFDFVEEIDAIVDRSGGTISCEVQGEVTVQCRLSGMPDLVLSFMNPRLLDNVSLHPCVRYKRWETDHILSFVPPDGAFKVRVPVPCRAGGPLAG